MEAIQTVRSLQESENSSKSNLLFKKIKRSYMEFKWSFVHKTQSEKRRDFFGHDPLTNG